MAFSPHRLRPMRLLFDDCTPTTQIRRPRRSKSAVLTRLEYTTDSSSATSSTSFERGRSPVRRVPQFAQRTRVAFGSTAPGPSLVQRQSAIHCEKKTPPRGTKVPFNKLLRQYPAPSGLTPAPGLTLPKTPQVAKRSFDCGTARSSHREVNRGNPPVSRTAAQCPVGSTIRSKTKPRVKKTEAELDAFFARLAQPKTFSRAVADCR